MKYAILFSLLLVGVCSGNLPQLQRNIQYEKTVSRENSNGGSDMSDMKTIEEGSQKQSYDSQRQGYNAQGQGYDAQRQGYDAQRQGYDAQRQGYDTQRQGYDAQRQGYDAQRQGYDAQRQGYDAQKQNYDGQRQGYDAQRQNYDSQSRDYESQKQSYDSQKQSYDSQKQEYDFQNKAVYTHQNFGWEQRDYNNQRLDQSQKVDRDDSTLNVEKDMKTDTRPRMLFENRRPHALLSFNELGSKVSDYLRGIFGHGSNSSYIAKVYSYQVPSFNDPLTIGDVDTCFATIAVKYQNVYFYGLRKAYQVIMQVDTKNYQIVTRIPLNKVEIKGLYTYSSRPIHNFTIILADTVYVQTTPYTLKDNKVELGKSSVQIQYGHETSFYDRIGFIAQVLQGQLGKHFVTSIITPQVHEYVSPKLTSLVERAVLDVSQNLERAHLVSALQEGIQESYKKIQEYLASSGNANFQLSGHDSQEYQYQHCSGQIVSVSLQNIQNLTLQNNTVSYTDSMIHSYVNLSLSQPIISVTISYHSQQDTQKHEIHVQYVVDSMYAQIELHKDLSGGELQLVGVKVYVSELQVASSQGQFEGEVGGLVNLLGSKLQQFVGHSCESFLQSQVSGILVKVNPAKPSSPDSETKYKTGGGYPGQGQCSEGQSGTGQYLGSGHTDMGQYGSEQNSDRGYSGYGRQQYPGKME